MAGPSGKPGRDCPRCPRLVAFRNDWRKKEPDWFNAPVASFGPIDARLLKKKEAEIRRSVLITC